MDTVKMHRESPKTYLNVCSDDFTFVHLFVTNCRDTSPPTVFPGTPQGFRSMWFFTSSYCFVFVFMLVAT